MTIKKAQGIRPRNVSDSEWFWNHVRKTPTCWLWIGTCFTDGYGAFYRGGQARRAHRESYAMAYGSVPKGMLICHTCDTPSCVRPTHLWPGTPKANLEDMVAKGRSLVGERNHFARLTADDVRQIRSLYRPGVVTMEQVGSQFGVTRKMVHAIVRRYAWTHIE